MVTAIDAGLMPLPHEDPWPRSKYCYKLLLYFSARPSTIASPVCANGTLIEGGCGFRATTPSACIRAIDELAREPAPCQEIGLTARRFVERETSYVLAFRVAELLKHWRDVAG